MEGRLTLRREVCVTEAVQYYTEVTPTTGMLLISAHVLDPFQNLRSFRKCDMVMNINPEDETSYSSQYQQAFLKYVEDKYGVKHRWIPVIGPKNLPGSNFLPSPKASGLGQLCFDPYDLSSDDEEYITPKSVADTTPRQSDWKVCILTAARLYMNSLPEAPNNLGQVNRISWWLPLQPNGHERYILVTGYHQLVASTRGNPLKVHWSLQCGPQHILCHATWCQCGGQFFPWARHERLQTF